MIDANTDLYAVFGRPVTHSKGPAIHNACFKYHGVNAVYLAFEPDEISKGILAMKTLGIKGASVTIPFKEPVMNYLDFIHEDAAKIGAVNTILNRDGKLVGFNTDYKAAIEPLLSFGIKDKKVCIIGAGGAAQAVAYGIHKENGALIIVNRNRERGEKLAQKYDADFIVSDKIETLFSTDIDILINTTPMGMHPNDEDLSFPVSLMPTPPVVMDIVYNPLETRLLKEAKEMGCPTIDGLSMFLYQGAAQFKLWTGITPDIAFMRNAI